MPPRPRNPSDRFWEKVDASGDCWLWTASQNGHGYGHFWFEGRTVKAHRWSYEHLVGAVPNGLDLDHLCRIRHCVNPDHLQVVTRSLNIRRGQGRHESHCPNGHRLQGANLKHNAKGARMCVICRQRQSKQAKQNYNERKAS